MDAIFNSKLIGIRSGTCVSDAKQMMKEKRIRHLPVVDENNKIVAMLSQRDLSDVAKFQDMPVDLFSSFPVKFVSLDTPLSSVALKMIEDKISSLLICDEKFAAVGIITTDDLLYHFSQMLKNNETAASTQIDPLSGLTTAGEFFRRLSEIGI